MLLCAGETALLSAVIDFTYIYIVVLNCSLVRIRLPNVFYPGEEFVEEYGLEPGWNDYDQVDAVVAGVRRSFLPPVDVAHLQDEPKRLEQRGTQFDLMVEYLQLVCENEDSASIYAFVSTLINASGGSSGNAGEAWRAVVGFAGTQIYPDLTVYDVQLRS